MLQEIVRKYLNLCVFMLLIAFAGHDFGASTILAEAADVDAILLLSRNTIKIDATEMGLCAKQVAAQVLEILVV